MLRRRRSWDDSKARVGRGCGDRHAHDAHEYETAVCRFRCPGIPPAAEEVRGTAAAMAHHQRSSAPAPRETGDDYAVLANMPTVL